mgnify:CR=1 FL=1
MNRYRNKQVYDANTGEIRDDKKFMVHSMAYLTDKKAKNPGDNIKLDWKPVTITNYQPMERKY